MDFINRHQSSWLDQRFPLRAFWQKHMKGYYAPKNLNFWYVFGALALLVLANQLLTGIWLATFYTPTADEAFSSVEYIMRDVNFGWLLRYLHSTGASAFFIVVYLHMFKGVMYGSYQKPRELLWLLGMGIYLFLMMEAFMGYLLPWGQMSYWGAQVIISLFSAIPWVGDELATWIRGDFTVTGVTLHRFYALHIVAIPLVFLFLVWMHLIALHHVGSNNPDGIEIKNKLHVTGHPADGVPFHPYYVVKDLVAAVVFLFVFLGVVFFVPEMGGFFLESANFEPANVLQTPEHIAPVWYFTPFYAILRAIPNKLMGVLAMGAAILFLFLLPWLDKCPVRSIRYRGWMCKTALISFAVSFIALGILGAMTISPERILLARIFTVVYFAFFALMPFYTRWDRTKPLPERVTR